MASYYGSTSRHASATSSAGDGAGHTPAADSANDATIAGAAEHSAASGATEHGPLTILSLADLQRLAKQQTNKTKHDLHREAREWLNYIANGYMDENVIDLAERWPQWSAWLATQPVAIQSFISDVAAFTAEAIENTKDPNRGGRLRVDFCVRLVDGSYWRFHPGQKVSSSAEPVYIPATLPNRTRGAAEHAAQQWSTISDDNIWTISHSELVPQTDRVGKNAVWQQISRLLMQNAIPAFPDAVDITDGKVFTWWLWISNLGHRTFDVIGNGIRQVRLSRTLEQEVVFKCLRVDNTEASVLLGLLVPHGASFVYVRTE